MAATINADNGVVSGSSGLKSTADTSGVLALQSNGTTGLTLNTSLALGVGSSPSYGTSGQLLTSAGSGAAPTWTDAPAPVPTFTASGSISAAGVTVALNSNGTVSEISGTTTSFSAGTGVAVPNNRNGSNMAAAYDPVNQKVLVLICYSTYLMGYVGTVSGTTITFGSEYQVFSVACQLVSVDYDTANAKFLVAAASSAGIRTVAVTISGSTISLGTAVILTSSSGWGTYIIPTTYNPVVGKFLIMATNGTDTTRMWVATMSGTTITENARYETSFPSQALVNGSAYSPVSGNIVSTYQSTVAGAGYQYVLSISMATAAPFVTVGTSTLLDGYNTGAYNVFSCPVFIGTSTAIGGSTGAYTLVILYLSTGGVWAKSGAESAGTILLSAPTSIGSTLSTSRPFVGINNNAGSNAAFMFVDGGDNYVKIATVFATTGQQPVLGAVNTVITTGDSGSNVGLAYDVSQGKSVAVYYTSATTRINNAVVTNAGYSTTAQSFIGFSTGSAANGASVGVSTYASVNSNVSGLTLGSRYNVTYTGTLTTSTTGFPFAGTAYGATKIRVGV